MAVLEKEQVETPRAVEAPATGGTAPTRRSNALVWSLAVLAVASVVTAIVLVAVRSGSTEDGGTATALAPMPDLRSDQRVLADLASAGYIPHEAVDWELLETEKLVNRRQIPAATLLPSMGAVEPLWTAEELAMIELAATGQIPKEAVDWQTVETKRLINRGLIPRAAAD